MIFSPEDTQLARERATRDIATFKPTGFMENARATWDEFNNNDRFGALRSQRREAWDERIATVKRLTGRDLDTPWNRFGEDNFVATFLGLRGFDDRIDQEGQFRIAPGPMALIGRMFDGVDNDLSEPERLRAHEAQIEELRASLPPEKRKLIPTREDMEAALRERAARLEARAADVGSRATGGGVVGQLAGAGGAAIVQPEVLITLPLGAPGRAGLLSKILVEAGIGAGSEAVLQPSVQAQRDDLGLDAGFNRAMANVALAGGGAGALTGVLGAIKVIGKGGVAAFENMVGRGATAGERALVRQIQNDADVEAQSPYVERDAAAQRVHMENQQVAYEAAVEGRALGEDDLVPADGLTTRAVTQDDDDIITLRGNDLRAIGVDAELMQFKSGGDAEGVTGRLKGVKKWDMERAGVSLIYEFEDGSRIIADGHQRMGLAKKLMAEGQDVGLPAIIIREADGVTPEIARARAAFKNISENTGSARDAAKVLRDMGATIEDMNLPPEGALVRDAEGLAKLDDVTFGMVINDILSEQFGAIIGRLVNDPRLQPEIAKLLVKLKPANAAEADSVVRQAVDAGVSRETQTSLFGDEEIVQSLFLEKARVLDRGMKMIRRNIDTFRTLNDRGDDITGAGNILDEASNAKRLETEKMLKEYLLRQAHRKGLVGDALTKAAREAQETGSYAGPAREFVQAVTRGIESGEINGDAVSRSGPDSELERAVEADAPEPEGDFEQVDDATLEMFSEPVSKASDEQSMAMHRELTDEAEAQSETVKQAQQDDKALRDDLAAQIDDGATVDEIESHPAVTTAIAQALAIPETHKAPGFMSDDWRANRQMTVEGEPVTGIDNAVTRLYDVWRGLAYADDGLPVPANPVRLERQATVILGPPASGKSSVANPIARHQGAMIIDSDEVKKTLPEFAGGIGANAVHEESGMIAKEVLSLAVDDGANIVIPKVGGSVSSIDKVVSQLAKDGYSVRIVNMAVSADEAYTRMLKRFVSTGRLVNPAYVRQVGDSPSRTFAELEKKGIGDGYSEIDNNGQIGEPKRITKDDGFLEGIDFGNAGARGPDGGLLRQATEQTEAGEQTLIDGIAPITDADRLRAKADAPMRGGARAADDGLFDLVARDQGNLLDFSVPVGEKIDADGKRVAETATIREVFEELEADQNFIEELKLCDGGGKAA